MAITAIVAAMAATLVILSGIVHPGLRGLFNKVSITYRSKGIEMVWAKDVILVKVLTLRFATIRST